MSSGVDVKLTKFEYGTKSLFVSLYLQL